MNKRYLGAAILSPLIIVLFLGGMYLKLLIAILSLMGMYEFFKVSKVNEINPITSIAYILSILYYILIINGNVDFQKVFLMIVFAVFLMLCIPVLWEKYNFIDVSVTILGFFYVTIFFSFIVLVDNKQYGDNLIWVIFISSWLCDTCAYYSGKFFGKTKLCPRVSPKKTIEGSIGGLLGSAIFCGIYGIVINKFGVSIPVYNFFIIGSIAGIVSQFGDLVASSIKRYVGVKDYSDLIPGHGGILDRFDSILFSALVVYYYVTIVIGI